MAIPQLVITLKGWSLHIDCRRVEPEPWTAGVPRKYVASGFAVPIAPGAPSNNKVTPQRIISEEQESTRFANPTAAQEAVIADLQTQIVKFDPENDEASSVDNAPSLKAIYKHLQADPGAAEHYGPYLTGLALRHGPKNPD